MTSAIYLEAFLKHVPRVLGQINSNPVSLSYGCCDRSYWHNHATAFPNARYQEAILTLALLYKHFEMPYRGNPHILTLINAGISYWIKIQEPDGSFNEWYPHEGSYVATAFSAYAVSEVLLILGRETILDYERAISSLEKSGRWLMDRSQKGVCNQQTGALMALYNTFLLTKKEIYKKVSEDYEEMIALCQTKEGWFPEYGGPDIGYLSLTIDYLTKYWKKSNSPRMHEVLTRAIDFIAYFVHRDGTSGGVYTSRETEYLIPHGFELLAKSNEKAAFIAWTNRRNIKDGKGVSIHAFDDRYLMYIGYTFLQASLDGVQDLAEKKIQLEPYHYFPESGLYIKRTNNLEIVANLKKAGTFVAIADKARISDSGVLIDGPEKLFSGYLKDDVHIVEVNENGFTVEGHFSTIRENFMTSVKSVLLNLFQITIGRFPAINALIKTHLRKQLILKQRQHPTTLRRTIKIKNGTLLIEDQLIDLGDFTRIIVGAKVSFIYVPSCRWYEVENLNDRPYQVFAASDLSIEENRTTIKRQFP